MHIIQHIIEPQRLLVVWQALQESGSTKLGSGRRYIVGELEYINDNIILRYLINSQDFKDAINLGFKGYSIFDIGQEVYDLNVMSTLERRIPPSQRADFDDFLRYYRIEPTVGRQMSEFALLGYTGGKLPGDNFSFIHTFKEAPVPCEIIIEVAGVRHYTNSLLLLESLLNTQVYFVAEPTNVQDPNAVAINTKEGKQIGYVNRAQTDIFNKWLSNNKTIEGFIERVNGTPERPNILLFVKVS